MSRLEESARRVLEEVSERAKLLLERTRSLNAHAAVIAATIGIPASFIIEPVVPLREATLPEGVYVLQRWTRTQRRRYRVYIREEEIGDYIRACRMATSARILEHYISRIYALPGVRLTWKDVQAARLVSWGLPHLVYAYDVGRLARIAAKIAATAGTKLCP